MANNQQGFLLNFGSDGKGQVYEVIQVVVHKVRFI